MHRTLSIVLLLAAAAATAAALAAGGFSQDPMAGSRSAGAGVWARGREAWVGYATVGWEVWREDPGLRPGLTRFEVRSLSPSDLSDPAWLSNPLPLGAAEFVTGGMTLPFVWDGPVLALDVPDAVLALGAGEVRVHQAGGGFDWSVQLG